jgi:hypothetical protein
LVSTIDGEEGELLCMEEGMSNWVRDERMRGELLCGKRGEGGGHPAAGGLLRGGDAGDPLSSAQERRDVRKKRTFAPPHVVDARAEWLETY